MKDLVINVETKEVTEVEVTAYEQAKRELDAAKAREEANKPIPPTQEQAQLQQLEERTIGMQEIDFYTLDQARIIDERSAAMQDIDAYTLDLVFQQQTLIDELRAEVNALKGGA